MAVFRPLRHLGGDEVKEPGEDCGIDVLPDARPVFLEGGLTRNCHG